VVPLEVMTSKSLSSNVAAEEYEISARSGGWMASPSDTGGLRRSLVPANHLPIEPTKRILELVHFSKSAFL